MTPNETILYSTMEKIYSLAVVDGNDKEILALIKQLAREAIEKVKG